MAADSLLINFNNRILYPAVSQLFSSNLVILRAQWSPLLRVTLVQNRNNINARSWPLD